MIKLGLLCEENILARLKQKARFALMCFVTKIGWFFQFTFQIKNLKAGWICCLQLMKTNHIICISKILTDLCFTKQKVKNKKYFWKSCFSSINVLTEHKEVCLGINAAQSVRLEKVTI